MATEVMVGPLPAEQDVERARKRRRSWIAWLAVILAIFLCLFACGQVSLLGAAPDTSGIASGSAMDADYTAWQGWSFGPLLPQIALEAIRDFGMGDPFQVATSTTCLLGDSCPTSTPFTGSATPTLGASVTPGLTASPIASPTPASTSTPTTPTNTPLPTATPTPLVYPVKLANPVNIPPGAASVQFTIMVINYGNPTGAELTEVIDRLPPEMSFAGGCNPGGCIAIGNEVRWSGSWVIAQGSYRTFRFNADVAGTLAGDVLTNEVETIGGNFETAVNVRRVYVYTPTPTATPTEVPIANPDGPFYIDEDTSITLDVLANDTNLRDLPLTVTASDPTHGTAFVLADNRILYAPDPDWHGTEVFTYRVTDVDGDFDIATVTVIVAPVNDVPLANPDAFYVVEDVSTDLAVLANDNGLGDTPVGVTILSGPSFGTASVVDPPPTGRPNAIRIRYLSNLNYNGPDSLVYQVCDPGHQVLGDGILGTPDDECDTAEVDITVLPANDRPEARDDGYTVLEDQVLDTTDLLYLPPPEASVLANDSDVDCASPLLDCNPDLPGLNPLTASPVGLRTTLHGTVNLFADGRFVYTPAPDFFGVDSFTYVACDGLLCSPAATVRITIDPDPSDAPMAVDDDFSTLEDIPLWLTVLANDTGVVDIPVTLTVIDPPDHGTASVSVIDGGSIPPDIRIWYVPEANGNSVLWGGPDELIYQVCDAEAECDTAVVRITVVAVHDPPQAVNDVGNMVEDQALPLTLDVLANDTPGDAPIDAGSVCIFGFGHACPPGGFPLAVGNGEITNIDPGSGEISYRPDDDFNGLDSFQYTVADTSGMSNDRSLPATVSVLVAPQDDVPVAVDDTAHTVLGTPVMISVLSNDLGIGDTPLTVTILTQPDPSDGSCAVVGTRVRFTPGPGFAGPVQCEYQVTDSYPLPLGPNNSDEAWITIFVNAPPVAVDDGPAEGAITDEDTPVVIDILANDFDPDFDGLDPSSVYIVDAPDHGSIVSIDPGSGAIEYLPAPRYNGSDTIRYRVSDLNVPPADSNTATVDITINSVNSQPDAQLDFAFTQQDTPINIDVLANDSDPDLPPDPLTITVVVDPDPPAGIASTTTIDDGGTPWDPSDDTLYYVPGPGAWGTEILTYTIDDGTGEPNSTDTTTVTVRVNAAPTAVEDSVVATEDVSSDIDVLANDLDPDSPPPGWEVVLVTSPAHGTAVILPSEQVRYSPDPDYNGSDSFSYTMTDGEGAQSTATVWLDIQPVDDIPIAVDDPGAGVLTVGEGETIAIDVLANDLGLGDTPISVVVSAGPTFSGCPASGAAVVLGSPGLPGGISIEYSAPDDECAGEVSFEYTVTDVDGDADTASVTLTVTPVNDPPVAVDDTATTLEDTSLTIDVAANDTDVDSPIVPSSVSIDSCLGGATCVANADGTVTYTPALNFHGVATFTYTIEDDQGAVSAPGTVTITVISVNDPPVARDDSATTDQGAPVTVNVVANDYDIDGTVAASTAVVASSPTRGSVVNNGNGTFTYTPADGQYASDSFTYQVADNDGAVSNVATVEIRIRQPELILVKEADRESAAPGEDIQYFITIINNGPGTAFSASVSDNLGSCFRWRGTPRFGSLGDLDQGEARVLAPRARVVSDPAPDCDDSNRAVVSAVNADSASDSVTVRIDYPVMGMSLMMLSVSEVTSTLMPTPTATVEPTITAESSLTPTIDPADPTPTVAPEGSETPTAIALDETPSATVAPPTPEGTPTAEATPIEPTVATDPPTEAPPTPEPVVVPTEETAVPEPSEPPAPSTDPPGPPAEPSPLGPLGESLGGGEEPPSESMASVLTNVRWDRLSRRPLWGGSNGLYIASDSRWLLRYLFGLFAPPGALGVSPTPMPGP